MDKETKKGLRVLAVIAAVIVLLFVFAGGQDNKASCIAKALTNKVDRANIKQHCGLLKRD